MAEGAIIGISEPAAALNRAAHAAQGPASTPSPWRRPGMLTAGAIFYLMGGAFHLISIVIGSIILVNGNFIGITADITDEMRGSLPYAWTACVVLPALGIIFGLLGAMFVLQVRKPGIALAGGVIGMLTGLLSGILVEGGEVSENPFGMTAFLFYFLGFGLVLAKVRVFR